MAQTKAQLLAGKSDQSVTFNDVTASSLNGGPFGGRNRIINGDMRIDQRNAGASFSAAAATLVYGIDRFYHYQTGAGVTAQRISSGLTDFPNALRVTGASGNTACEVSQRIESVNCADLVGKTVTVSFTAAHSGNGTVSVGLINPNGVDNYSATTSIESKTQVLTSTLTRYSLSFNALPAGAANGLLLVFNNASGLGSGVTFTITGVQLEAGSVATPFERRSYGQELSLCQRYYQTAVMTFTVGVEGGRNTQIPFPLKVSMRTAPTCTFSGGTATNGAVLATPVTNITTEMVCPQVWLGGAGSLQNGLFSGYTFTASSEL